jgi:hypothetical protein
MKEAVMDYEMALQMYRIIRGTKAIEEWNEAVDVGVRYAQARVEYLRADVEQKRWLGPDRAATHNAFIMACDILSRRMREHGEDATWRTLLGSDRRRLGDFACYIHCILGLSAGAF